MRTLSILLAMILVPSSASAEELSVVMRSVQQLQQANVQCVAPTYDPTPPLMTPGPHMRPICNQCKQEVESWKAQIQKDANTAVGNDGALTAQGSAATSQAANSMAQAQRAGQQHANTNYQAGSNTQAGRSQNAAQLASQFQQCASEIQSACSGSIAPDDQAAGQQASQACNSGAQDATRVAQEKASSGGGMQGLGEIAGALGQALGPLAQLMQKKPSTNSGLTGPDSSSGINAPPASINLGSRPGASTVGISEVATAGESLGETALGQSGNYAGTGSSSAGSYPHSAVGEFGLGSGINTSGDVSAMPGTSSGSGGGSGRNSSGSSTAPKDALAKSSESFEYSGGGGAKSAFLGLKSKGNELAELAGADLGRGNDIFKSEGERTLASEESAADVHSEDASTLFRVIHLKMVEVSRRGNI